MSTNQTSFIKIFNKNLSPLQTLPRRTPLLPRPPLPPVSSFPLPPPPLPPSSPAPPSFLESDTG